LNNPGRSRPRPPICLPVAFIGDNSEDARLDSFCVGGEGLHAGTLGECLIVAFILSSFHFLPGAKRVPCAYPDEAGRSGTWPVPLPSTSETRGMHCVSPTRQPGGQIFQLLDVAAADHHVVRFRAAINRFTTSANEFLPFRLPILFQTANPNNPRKSPSCKAVSNSIGSKAPYNHGPNRGRAQAEKQHSPLL